MDTDEEKHQHNTLKFPDKFLWGAATSAHQVEGNNTNSDWWEWEERVQPPEKRSGQAVNQYELYEQDFGLAKQLNHNAHRLSIEWSRIEPEEGKFDEDAISHYVEVLRTLKEYGFSVMLTLHHFTNPLWFSKLGGWENSKSSFYFERFVKKILPRIKNHVDLWITINEPGILVWAGYIGGKFPPQKKNRLTAYWVHWNLAKAHKKAYKAIHQEIPEAKVGFSQNIHSFNRLHKHSIREGVAEWIYDMSYNHAFYLMTGKKTHDFIGLNYYYNWYISFNGRSHLPELLDVIEVKKDVSDLGWEIFPEGMFSVLMDFSDYHLPIYITENGIASTNDDRRVRFLLSYLKEIYHAISAGIDVRGYFHWSLVDNFEWADGFEPRFGLIEVNHRTQERKFRPSSFVYAEIIRNNGIPHHLLKLLGHSIKVSDVLAEMEK